jgi:hypothetical protein
VNRWLLRHGYDPGETVGVTQVCELAYAWWNDRLDSGWRPHTRGQNQAILEEVGLNGSFWRLT